MTMLDYPGEAACIVYTKGCNLRCGYCHNASLVTGEAQGISEAEVLEYLDKRKGLLDGVVISGGEPLLHTDLADFLRSVKSRGYKIKLDTNGTYPDRLKAVYEAGLVDMVAMDVKSGDRTYAKTVGTPGIDMDAVRESIAYIKDEVADYEFRTTAIKGIHTADDFEDISRMIEGASAHFIQNFKDSGELLNGEGLDSFSEDELNHFADIMKKRVDKVTVR